MHRQNGKKYPSAKFDHFCSLCKLKTTTLSRVYVCMFQIFPMIHWIFKIKKRHFLRLKKAVIFLQINIQLNGYVIPQTKSYSLIFLIGYFSLDHTHPEIPKAIIQHDVYIFQKGSRIILRKSVHKTGKKNVDNNIKGAIFDLNNISKI